MTPMTQDEKIDAIYEMFKKSEARQKRNTWVKIIFWITMFAYSYYITVYTLPNLMKSMMPMLGGNAASAQVENLGSSQMQKLLEQYLAK